ncbi:MAG: carboxypeptidase [Bacteroidota bacterium]
MRHTLLLLLMFSSALLFAQEKEMPTPPIPEAKVYTSTHEAKIGGRNMEIEAEAGTMQIRNEKNEPIANFGYTYYRQKDARRVRPVVFAFNGGPGSSSFWLHMGVLGPKRIVVNDPESTPAAPYEIINNDYSILDVADLVMMDPIGTGLSIPVGKAKFEDFWGVDQDIRSLSFFVTQFLIEKGLMNAPKYLLGESYGTFRNAGLMDALLNQGIAMNGVIMVSAVFDLRTLIFPPDDDLPYICHFPTYAATAWYHDKLDTEYSDVYKFLDEVRTFTEEEYVPALFKGDRLTATEKRAVAQKLAGYTGTDTDYWVKANLRVTNSEFFAEAMREEGKIVGRLDSRYTGINQDLISQTGSHDPQSSAISPAYITGFMHYFYNDLKVDKSEMYITSAGKRDGFRWDWNHSGNSRWNTQAAINTGPDMARALSRDPNMKVLVLNGIYDIATVFYGVEYSIDHLGLTPDIRKNIIMEYYEAGHMMYTHKPSLLKFKEDVEKFIKATSKR